MTDGDSISEKNRKRFSLRNSGAIRALLERYSMAMLLCDIRKRERRTAKNSTYFHFLCRTNRADGAFLSFKDHFPAIPSDDCSQGSSPFTSSYCGYTFA